MRAAHESQACFSAESGGHSDSCRRAFVASEVLSNQRLRQPSVDATDLEAVRLELFAIGVPVSQQLPLSDKAEHCFAEAVDPLWGPGSGAPRAFDSVS